jgi:anti-sigma factor RsiW
MSHLGDLLSGLVDGELSGAELDRANAHLASCGVCRTEANALRRLKHELHELAGACDADEITRRLLAMAGPDGRDRRYDHAVLVPDRDQGRERGEHHRGRRVIWGTVSLVVVGIGAAAFGMGGGGSTGPQITPQVEVFDVQHAITSGDVPYTDPADRFARVPAVATTP